MRVLEDRFLELSDSITPVCHLFIEFNILLAIGLEASILSWFTRTYVFEESS